MSTPRKNKKKDELSFFFFLKILGELLQSSYIYIFFPLSFMKIGAILVLYIKEHRKRCYSFNNRGRGCHRQSCVSGALERGLDSGAEAY